jgi:pilus assembly protein CpaB
VLGKTVTLELNSLQAQALATSRQAGTLSLALRSIADGKTTDITLDETALKRDGVSIIRYGVPTQATKAR